MGIIIKIKDRFFFWSSVVDAPTTNGMNIHELIKNLEETGGTDAMLDLPNRLKRVHAHGTSCKPPQKLEELIKGNHAGDADEELTADQIYEIYTDVEDRRKEFVVFKLDEKGSPINPPACHRCRGKEYGPIAESVDALPVAFVCLRCGHKYWATRDVPSEFPDAP